MRPTPRLLLSFLACSAFYSAPHAPQCRAEDPPAWSEFETPNSPEEKAMYERRARIRAEIDDIKSGKIKPAAEWATEWANKYYAGDGLGSNITYFIAPANGFVYTNRGCEGLYEFNHGDIIESTADGIRVRLEHPLDARRPEISEWLYFVRWGKYKLLLSQPQLVAFINSVREQSRPSPFRLPSAESHMLFWILVELPQERPQIPERFRPLLDVPPIMATVTEVRLENRGESMMNGTHSESHEFRFDKGRLDNVQPGTRFETPWASGFITIDSVDDHSASAHSFMFVKDDGSQPTPKVGDSVRVLTVPPEFLAPTPAEP